MALEAEFKAEESELEETKKADEILDTHLKSYYKNMAKFKETKDW